MKIVQFQDELIVLDINEKILLSLQYKDGRLSSMAAIEIPGQSHCTKNFQVIGDIAAVYQTEANTICILNTLHF